MATKSFKDICVEYAHQLGKGLPLTPAEMCNAVIMYLNAQITEMQSITTALQTAVTEAEASATEATNTANELSEKVDTLQANVTEAESNATEAINTANELSGKVDTLQTAVTEAESNATEAINTANELSGKVDTLQTAVTEAESNATEALNTANGVSETVNALPKVPSPTTSDNGKVIGVQSGAYTLVEHSTEPPANMVTTDTIQTINGTKIFNSDIVLSSAACVFTIYKNDSMGDYTRYGYNYIMTGQVVPTIRYILNIPNKNGTLATLDDIPTPVTKYFTRVVFYDANADTLYLFSCVTEGDLSGNNVYGDVVSLLTELGAINSSTMLPCSGKTSAGGAVIGVYTDGSAITVFSGDNATEEIPTTAEINIISK